MHVSIVGLPGSGKSVLSQRFIEKGLRRVGGKVPKWERLFSTVPLIGHDAPCVEVAGNRKDAARKRLPCLLDVTCGVVFVDELHRFFPARGYKDREPEELDWWQAHRHRDLFIVSNTQHPSFLDRTARIITDSVFLCKLLSLPLLGALVPRTVRPPDPCHCLDALGPGYEHTRRDAPGDRATAYGRWCKTGAVILWNEYPPSVLNDEESLDMTYIAAQGIKSRRRSFLLFDMKYAGMARRTVRDIPPPPPELAAACGKSEQAALLPEPF